MDVNEFVLVQGMRDTRGALERWNADPWSVVRSWGGGAFAVASLLLVAVWAVASKTTPESTGLWPRELYIPGLSGEPAASEVAHILARNALVLALHATACVAGFIAGSSLALSADRRTGLDKWVHEKARPIALGWVVLVTGFSLITQAYALGLTGSQLAYQLDVSPLVLVLTVIPHAVPELTALFLPLAAWTIASRRDEWHDLLAATFATVAFAIPILVAAAVWETYAWPHLLDAVSPVY